MQERRQYVRVTTPVMVEFPNPQTLKTERTFTKDISEGGMRFPTAVKLESGREMPVTLEFPFHGATMHATAEVLWVRETARSGTAHYEVGVRFRWIDEPDRQRLSRHLATFLSVQQ